MNTGALAGVRVLDLSRVLAGPYCTMLLGDYGADVIKVEEPSSGDGTRSWGPPWVGDQSAYYLSANRNKRSLTVNLKADEGVAIIKRLAAISDVVIENFKPGTAARMGLGYDALAADNAGLVYCSLTGYGQRRTVSRPARLRLRDPGPRWHYVAHRPRRGGTVQGRRCHRRYHDRPIRRHSHPCCAARTPAKRQGAGDRCGAARCAGGLAGQCRPELPGHRRNPRSLRQCASQHRTV